MTDLAELKRLAETLKPFDNFVSDEPLYNILANECNADLYSLSTKRFRALQNAILSLIERVEKAEAELLEMQKDEASLLLIAHLDGADRGRKAGRAEALEEAAKWHEAEIERLEDQIEHNNEYARRSGNFDGEANDFCRSLISNHRSGAAAIRALGEKAG